MRIKLEAVMDEPVEIEDRKGNVFYADPELTGQEALYFISEGQDYTSAEFFHRCGAIISRCLIERHPDMTEEKVLAHFRVFELAQLISRFLILTGQRPSSAPKPQEPTIPKTSTATRRKRQPKLA